MLFIIPGGVFTKDTVWGYVNVTEQVNLREFVITILDGEVYIYRGSRDNGTINPAAARAIAFCGLLCDFLGGFHHGGIKEDAGLQGQSMAGALEWTANSHGCFR
ncbi:hypothetical protein D8I35_10220 [Corticibacter populi]|uniref:Uncharacterized protein n=1 Tax=Corticibacter populi TaxID=1550736 RepID=A0A3M6QV08_9BURK|nr:hypothetical protein D8I35_10220 [Corticibacter populi]